MPTFRRQHLLLRLLETIARARVPAGLKPHVIIIDNDATAELHEVLAFVDAWRVPTVVLEMPRAGKSNALNAGLAFCNSEYVAFLDDDETIEPSWFEVASAVLADRRWDFVSGRSLPLWCSTPPAWLPRSCPAVLGIVDSGPVAREYDDTFPGMLTGGNAIVRLALLRDLGGFASDLGPSRTHRRLSGEDEDLHQRLMAAGARGLYVPQLVVRHRIHPDRVRKAYYRSWFFWNGTAKGVMTRRRRERVPYWLGAPRYLYGRAVRSSFDLARRVSTGDTRTLEHEAAWWLLLGFLHGRYFHATARSVGSPAPARLALANHTAVS